MSDYRLVGTSPEDGSLVPVAVTSAGLLKTSIGKIEAIPNDVEIQGNLTVTGEYIGLPDVDSGLPAGGEEGMVLSIMNGEPTWVFFEPPEPPPPADYVALVDNRDATPAGTRDYGMRDDNKNLVYPPNSWDEYIRSLAAFEAGRAIAVGVSCLGAPSGSTYRIDMPFQLDISGNFGRVLEIHVTGKSYQDMSNPGLFTMELTTTADHVTPISNRAQCDTWSCSNRETFTFLLNRADLGVVDFVLTGTVSDLGHTTKVESLAVNGFRCVDSSRYMLQLLAERAQGLAEPR